MANNPPRRIDIKGQDHMLAYITPEEGGILQLLGGSGAPGPMGIPSFFDAGDDASAGVDGPSGEADGGASSDPSGPGTDSPSSNEPDDNYSASDAISAAMAASSPTAGPGVGIGDMSNINSYGLEDMSIANQNAAMGGLSAGVTGLETMQGAANYTPVTNVPYDIFGFVKGAMNRHARDSLSKGYSPEFSVNQRGDITSVTGKGGPGMSMPGLGGLMSMIGANMGAVTTTGYAGKGVDDMRGMGGDDNDIVKDARTFLGEDIAEIEDDKVVGESFIDPLLLKYLKRRPAAPVSEVGYNQDLTASSSAKPVDFSAIDRGLQKTQSGIESINRNRY